MHLFKAQNIVVNLTYFAWHKNSNTIYKNYFGLWKTTKFLKGGILNIEKGGAFKKPVEQVDLLCFYAEKRLGIITPPP